MTKVLSFDPGATSGWCYQDEDQVFAMSQTTDINGFLEAWDIAKLPVDHVVFEGYRINPHQATQNVGIRLVTVEAIGSIVQWATFKKIKFTEYLPMLKPQQAKLTQIFPKKMRKDISHKFDAFNHGRYYLIKNHGAPTALEQKMKEQGKL